MKYILGLLFLAAAPAFADEAQPLPMTGTIVCEEPSQWHDPLILNLQINEGIIRGFYVDSSRRNPSRGYVTGNLTYTKTSIGGGHSPLRTMAVVRGEVQFLTDDEGIDTELTGVVLQSLLPLRSFGAGFIRDGVTGFGPIESRALPLFYRTMKCDFNFAPIPETD